VTFIGLAGCAGRDLGAEARAVRVTSSIARQNGAEACAAVELALAEAHLEFARRLLDDGDTFEARDHLRLAGESAGQALRMASAPGCVRDSSGRGLSSAFQ
jgi:hypothetical protein